METTSGHCGDGNSPTPTPGPGHSHKSLGRIWSQAWPHGAKRRGFLLSGLAAVTRALARMRGPQRRPPRLLPSLIRVLGERAPCACPAAELLIKLHWGEARRRRRGSASSRRVSECGAPGRAGERGRGLHFLPERGSPSGLESGRGGGVGPRAERKPPGPAGQEVGRVPACRGSSGRGWGGPSSCGGLLAAGVGGP